MSKPILSVSSRAHALAKMSDEEGLDVLVIGGGVTGAGIALDAATRGLRTGIVEMQDWASGTSSRSSKLVHGGLRYLYALDFALVAEALKERGLLLKTTAPHLVKAQPFLWPLKMPVVERSYSAIGVGMYDTLAAIGTTGGASVPVQKHYSKRGALELFPDIRDDQISGAIRFYDARVDDARLVLGLVRTAVEYGAYAAARTQVVDMTKDEHGAVTGAVVKDLENGETHTIKASRIIAATGVWTEETEALGADKKGLQVMASKGVHLVFDRDRIKGSTGLFLRTDKSVLFIIPWQRYWVVGTTDTGWHEERQHPVPNREDIDYVLNEANKVLSSNLGHDDIIGTYAGLRPLLQPADKESADSAKVSREHTVAQLAPGLIAISGGKLTTYRRMAEDAVDFALGKTQAQALPSVTPQTPLVGAAGLPAATAHWQAAGSARGWDDARIEHLLNRYGSEVETLAEMIDEDPSLGDPLASAPAYLKAEVAFGVLYEGAMHLEDMLLHRIRLDYETRDRGVGALDEVCEIMAPMLGWDLARAAHEKDLYRQRAEAYRAAETENDDAAASRVRVAAPDIVPLEHLSKGE